MTINIENLSDAQLVELKQNCESLLNTRRTNKIKENLNKLFSIIEELDRLDPDASIIDDGMDNYSWSGLETYIKNTYNY